MNRLQKTLEKANLKLASVATDVPGATVRAILGAIVAGKGEVQELAGLTNAVVTHLNKSWEGKVLPEFTQQ